MYRTFLIFRAVLACIIVFGITILNGCRKTDAGIEPYNHLVNTEVLHLSDRYMIKQRFVGKVESRKRLSVGFELIGTVAVIEVDDSELVVKGQKLAQLDTSLLELEGQEYVALLAEMKAKENLNQLELRRQTRLTGKGFGVKQRLDELLAEQESLNAQIARIRATLMGIQIKINKSTLFAPYDGIVAKRFVDVGRVVSATQPVLKILERSEFEARVGIPVLLVETIKQGDKAKVFIGDYGMTAEVIALGNTVDPVSRTVEVRLSLPGSSSLVDGDLVFLELIEHRDRFGFWVPSSALVDGVRGMWNILVAGQIKGEDVARPLRQLEARSVEVIYFDNDSVFIDGALKDGEVIVSSGVHRFASGQIVIPKGVKG